MLNSTVPIKAYNFAQVGACVDSVQCMWTAEKISEKISFRDQVEAFAQSDLASGGHPVLEQPSWTDINAIFIIWFGINDVLWTVGAFAKDGSSVVDHILDSYMESVRKLRDGGATRFVFIGIPRE